MKHILKKILLVAMCLITLGTLFAPAALAENVCKQIMGDSKAEKTFVVKTNSRWYSSKDVLKLSQTKGVMKTMRGAYYDTSLDFSKNKATGTKEMYEKYFVKVEKKNASGKYVTVETILFEDGSKKIRLEKNSTYRITVTPVFQEFARKMKDRKFFVQNPQLNPYAMESDQGNIFSRLFRSISVSRWKPLGWQKHSTWRISSTSGIGGCAF